MASGPPGLARLPSLQAALLGVAGLLPSQRGLAVSENWPGRLEAAWAEQADALAAPLPPGTWRT